MATRSLSTRWCAMLMLICGTRLVSGAKEIFVRGARKPFTWNEPTNEEIQSAEDNTEVHLHIGGANCRFPPTFKRLQALAKRGAKVYIFEPNPRWRNECGSVAHTLGGELIPFAAWVRNETLSFYTHEDQHGVGSSLFNASIYATQGKKKGEVQVQALDLADWMRQRIPRRDDNGQRVRISMRLDVEGAEYIVLRSLILSGEACRLTSLVFEAHAVINARHAKFRAFDVLVPWLLHGCAKPVVVQVERYYGTPNSVHNGWTPYDRHIEWEDDWCRECRMLDQVIDPNAT